MGKPIQNNSRVVEKARAAGVSFIKKQSVNRQIRIMKQALQRGHLSADKLRKELEANAKIEMRKGADRIRKSGSIPTVELLMADYYKEPEFRSLAADVGLDAAWFTKLAEAESGRS